MRLITTITIATCFIVPAGSSQAGTYSGRVLPFQIIEAIKNYAYNEGMRPAQVSVSIQGGTQSDWIATAAYVAEKSIVADATFAEVEVFVRTPWGNKPPTADKMLAKAYYAGSDPSQSPWPDDPWSVIAQGHALALPDIEFVELSDSIFEKASDTGHPITEEVADAKAAVLVKKKYRLPPSWKPDDNYGPSDLKSVTAKRGEIKIEHGPDVDASITKLQRCLTDPNATGTFRGCQNVSEDYVFKP